LSRTGELNKLICTSPGWKSQTLAELCDFSSGLWKGKQPPYRNVGVIRNTNFNADGTLNDSDIAYLDVEERQFAKRALQFGDIILEKSGGGPKQPVGRVIFFDKHEEGYSFSNFTACVRSKTPGILNPVYLHRYLYWIYAAGITESMQSHSTGIRNLNLNSYKDLVLCYPSIKEQERIVTTLDEAFEELAVARGKVELMISRARALFESELQAAFSSPERQVSLSDLASDITDGDHSPPPKTLTGIPFITISNIVKDNRTIDFGDTFTVAREYFEQIKPNRKPRRGDILYTVTGATLGIPVHVDQDIEFCFQRHIGLIRPKTTVDSLWLSYAMLSPQFFNQASAGATGAAQKTVSLTLLRNIKVPQCSFSEQTALAVRLNKLEDAVRSLVAVYSAKLTAIDDLKQSILSQAFSGLFSRPSRAMVIPFPCTLPDVSSTDLHVGILAIAYAFHDRAGKASDFGHVKAEKIAHMVEAYVGVDLGRAPVRDAAGPNDFPHLKKVEHRADRAGYLTFARQAGGGYRVTKKSGFDFLVTKTRAAFGERNQDLDRLLDLMTPMSTKQAEIFATVYAAWNNLLMDGEPVTDEHIVRAAREDWHSDKLNIPRDKFFSAIEWIRTKNLCPEGKGKRVEAKKH
jgi:type I restriction enzyme S subunit